jgi:thymidine kinase
MNASKSAQILMQTFNFERQGKTFLIFKPRFDTRDGCFVKSRALDEQREAIGVDSSEEGIMYSTAAFEQPDFVFVDELQFMSAQQVEELAHISMDLNIPVFAYGLLISYTGELFEGSKRAIECGFTLKELKMQCDMCTEKSTHHLLYQDGKAVKEGNPLQVGDTEYQSVCFTCYNDALN